MRDGIYIVDADGHVMDWPDRCYRRYLPPEYARRGTFFPSQGWDRRQAPFGDRGRNPATPEEHLADNDQEGIDLQILYPTQALTIGEIREPEYQIALCRAYNNWVADYCKADPARLKAVAIVPVRDPTEACRELNRAVADLGLVGVMFPTFIRGRNVADRFFWPIYGEAERLGVPVAMHATGSETGDIGRFENFLGVHVWSHVPEQLIALTSVILGGIPEVFKELRLAFLEAGCGWVPFWMEHLDGEFEKRPFDAPLCQAKPSEYMRCGRLYYACEPEEKTIPYVAEWVGIDQLLYASDYPHWDSEWPNTVRTLLEREDLSLEQKQKILGENALRFYGIKTAVPA
jgi:predicted TIM-barrel fold metal-dependent hydrolase